MSEALRKQNSVSQWIPMRTDYKSKLERIAIMSNTICVKTGSRTGYFPFRWIGDMLQAFISREWQNVTRTSKKNAHGDYIFTIK